jgi:hypothetical protein
MTGITAPSLDAVVVRFDYANEALRRRVSRAVDECAADVFGAVADKLEGAVLKRRTGQLRESLKIVTQDSEAAHTAIIGVDTPYARFLEDGTEPHVIVPVNKKALAFMVGDKQVFAKKVNHPGNKAYLFLKGTLAEHEPDIRVRLLEAATGSLQGGAA